MNSSAIGIEAGNDGTGELWTRVQTDAYLTMVDALCAAYAIPTSRVHSHWEWTQRKTDPAGPDFYSTPPSDPCGPSALSWNMDAFRADLVGGEAPAPITTRLRASEDDDDMKTLLKAHGRDEVFVFSGNAITWAWDEATLGALYDVGAVTGMDDARSVDWTTIQHYIDHCWTGGAVPSGYKQPA